GCKPMTVAAAQASAMVRAIGCGLVAACDRLPVVIAEATCHPRRKPGVVQRAKEVIQPRFEGPVHAAVTYWVTDMPAFSAASGSFHVKSSFTSFVTVFVTVRLLPFFLTVVLICSSTLMVSTFGARPYTDQRYWSMHASLRTHSSEASSGLTLTSGSASGTFMTGSATAAAASE